MKKQFKEFLDIENEFYELDKENKIAYMKLEFERPSDLFDQNTISNTPILSTEYIRWVSDSFERAPRGYKIDLKILFNDLEDYDNEKLNDIFKKNMFLEFKKIERIANSKNIIAYSLIIIGIIFFVIMILINNLWKDGGILKDIFKYVSDVAPTVTFWEAMTILVVENKERRSYMKNLYSRFDNIEFKKKEI